MNLSLKKMMGVLALSATCSCATAAEFSTYVPGTGNLVNDNASGGAEFAPVSVTGYTGVGGEFNGYFYTGSAKPVDSFFRFFCIDLSQFASFGPSPYTSSLWNDDELRKLFDVAYPNGTAGDFWNGSQTNFGVFADATTAAAFQVAVWNIFFDDDLSLSSGTFKWTGGTTAVSIAAKGMLDSVAAYSGNGYTNWTLYRFASTGYQDYLSATHRAPEPGTLALVGLALLSVAFLRQRVSLC